MRQYDDPVEVRRGEAEGPDQFRWRGRLWKVRAVLAHWVETGGTGDETTHGVLVPSLDRTDGRWRLVGCRD